MKSKLTQFVSALALVTLAAGISMTETGQDVSNRILRSIGAAAAGSDARYELQVVISTTDSRSFEMTVPLSDQEFRDLRSRPERHKEKYVMLAKKGMAEKFGYHENLYGQEHYKMLASPRPTAINLIDKSSHRTEDLFRDERRQASFSQLYAN